MKSKTINTCWIIVATLFVLTCSIPVPAHCPSHSGTTLPGGSTPGGPEGPDPNNGPAEKNPCLDAEPVALNTGEFLLTATDLTIKGRVLSVVLERAYRSRSEYNGQFGYGWDIGYNTKIRKLDDPNTLILLDGRNRKCEYSLDPSADPDHPVYLPPPGRYDYIKENDDGTYTMFQKHGTKLAFDVNGNLTAIIDRNDNRIRFEYDPRGALPLYGASDFFVGQTHGLIALEFRLVRIIDDVGREISLSYDGDGRLSKVVDFAGRTWTYAYDQSTNALLSVTGPGTAQYPNGLTTTYAYDSGHNLTSITDPNNQTYLANHYDDHDRVESQQYGDGTFSFAYDPANNRTVVTDRRGFRKEIVYNEAGNPISETRYTEGLRETDPDSYTTVYEYNSNMERTRIIYPAGNCVDYTYDERGNVTAIRQKSAPGIDPGDPNNLVTAFTYEPRFDFIKTTTDPRGYTTTYVYDYEDPNYSSEAGNLVRIVHPDVDGVMPSERFTYNEHGRVETATAADGIVTKYEYYDAAEPNGPGLLSRMVRDFGTGPECLNITTAFRYSAIGDVVAITDAEGYVSTFEHDSLGRVTRAMAPEPLEYSTDFTYDKNGNLLQSRRETGIPEQPWQVTTFTYDLLDNLRSTTDHLGHTMALDYDKNENRTRVTDPEDNNSVMVYDERDLLWQTIDAEGDITEYSYGGNGKLSHVADAADNVTVYNYDAFDRVDTIIYPDDTNEVFVYDENSNILSRKTRNDDQITYLYDPLNRLSVKTVPDGAATTYKYDLCNRLTEMKLGSRSTGYQYDRLGRLIQVTYPGGRTVGYEYDRLGRRSKLIYPDATAVLYTYDALSRLTTITTDSNSLLAGFEYDALSRRTKTLFANGAHSTYEYDLSDRLISLDSKGGAWARTYHYTHDRAGNRLSMTVDTADAYAYSYDRTYRLRRVDYPDSTSVNYLYDPVGNRTNVSNGGSTDYSVNNLNQYTSVDGTALTYDRNGNLSVAGSSMFTHTAENRLKMLSVPGSLALYEYDADNRRVKANVNGWVTEYVHDGDRIIAEYGPGGSLARKYVYGPALDEPIAMISGSSTYCYALDGLGSVAAISDSDGKLVEQYEYDAFGTPRIASAGGQTIAESLIGNPYMFTARRYDTKTRLYYYRARDYSPEFGRFLQPDPAGYLSGMNLYAYCRNNPINMVDPSGLWYIDINVGGGFWIGGTGGILIGSEGIYPYIGGGGVTPGIGAAILVSPMDPTTGWNAGIQGAVGPAVQWGTSLETGEEFFEVGVGIEGASATAYYVFDPWKWPWKGAKECISEYAADVAAGASQVTDPGSDYNRLRKTPVVGAPARNIDQALFGWLRPILDEIEKASWFW